MMAANNVCGRSAMLGLLLYATLHAGGCGPRLHRYEYGESKMGSPFRIVLYAANPATAGAAADAAFARIDRLNALLSDYDPQSELSQLSVRSTRAAPTKPVVVSDELWQVLERSLSLSKQTDGAFDVTVGPYVRLWRRARRQRALPTPQRLQAAREAVGYQHVHLDPDSRTVQLLAANMRLDLGGIAKGYAADEAMAVLGEYGIKHALVDAGGDMVVSLAPPGRDGWIVAVQTSSDDTAPPGPTVLLRHAAIATSGDMFRYVEIDAIRYSHIIDPATGLGLTRRVAVSVIAPDAITADSLASALSVLEPQRGLSLVEAQSGVEARIITLDDGRLVTHTSTGFERYVQASGSR